MSELRLTEEQGHAIAAREGPLFLHAGAGSGKTRVLVERFVRAVLEDGVGVEQILAITFTDKAALELRARIRSRFVELGEGEHARSVDGAWVSTFHGFCARLLRAHPLPVGLDPEFKVLEATVAGRLASEAFDLALGDFLERSNPKRLELAAVYGPDRLQPMVRAVFERQRSRGERRPELPEIPPPRAAGEREALLAALGSAERELAGASGTRVDEAHERMGRCADLLAALGAEEVGDIGQLKKLAVGKGAGALKTPVFDSLRDAHAAYLAHCVGHRAHANYELIRDLVVTYGRRYEEAKSTRSALDFEDLELIARDLLEREHGLRRSIRSRFRHVMVDEFQDTNRRQADLLRLVADENLFTVGDARQSIYAFRNADLRGFEAARAGAEEAGRVARLAVNFRSRRDVLAAVNGAFGAVWPDHHPLEHPGGEDAPRAPGPSVELLATDLSKRRWDEHFAGEEQPFGFPAQRVTPWRAAEARLLARRVRALVADGGPYRPGEVAVLLRARTDVATYERALEEQGVPTHVVGGRGYWGQQQIVDLRAYLGALANPLDELSLYSVLASPLVGVSLDALALLGRHARERHRDPWWALQGAFCRAEPEASALVESLAADDRARLEGFCPRFEAERVLSARLGLEALIERGVSASGYDLAVLAMPGGRRRMANVRKLMRIAREFEADQGPDLRAFVDFLEGQGRIEAQEGEAPLEGEGLDAVAIMSIHTAKGLEFPVVCLADLGRAGREDQDALRVTEDGRIGLSVASMTGGSTAGLALEDIKAEEKRRGEEEERRVFYVAVTRAREHLVLSGAFDMEKWSEPKELGVPMEWIWPAFVPDLRERAAEAPAGEAMRDGVRVRYELCTPASVEEALPAPARAPARGGAVPAGAGANGAPAPEWPSLPVATASPVPRVSYSALQSYARCGYRFYLERVLRLPVVEVVPGEPRDEEGGPGRTRLDAMARGSAVHQLLEGIDFASPAVPEPEAVRALMARTGREPDEEDVEELREMVGAFVGSDLCRRLGRAGHVRAEVSFAFELSLERGRTGVPGLIVSGVLDAHAVEDGRALVVDYKSDSLEGVDPAALVAERYAVQRLIYALAALRAGASGVEVMHVFLERPDDPVTAVYEAGDATALEGRLREVVSGVTQGEFAPTDRPHRDLCVGCPGQAALCSWDLEQTMAEHPPPEDAAAGGRAPAGSQAS